MRVVPVIVAPLQFLYGDTLEITGFVPICEELRVVAFRSGNGIHVQVEPSDFKQPPQQVAMCFGL